MGFIELCKSKRRILKRIYDHVLIGRIDKNILLYIIAK